MIEQGHKAIADQIDRGFVTGKEQEEDHSDQLVAAQMVAGLLDRDQPGDQLVVRFAALQFEQVFEKSEQLRHRGQPPDGAADRLVVDFDQPYHLMMERQTPLFRDAEHLGNDAER